MKQGPWTQIEHIRCSIFKSAMEYISACFLCVQMDEPGSNIWLYVKGSEMKGVPCWLWTQIQKIKVKCVCYKSADNDGIWCIIKNHQNNGLSETIKLWHLLVWLAQVTKNHRCHQPYYRWAWCIAFYTWPSPKIINVVYVANNMMYSYRAVMIGVFASKTSITIT